LPEGIDPRYFVEAAAKVLEVLESFDSPEEELTASEIARRVGISYSSAFRLLYTLEKRGYVMRRPGSRKYRYTPAHRRFRIGYAALDNRTVFSDAICRSMVLASRKAGIELLVKDNELSPQKALANVDILIEEKINLLVEYQRDESVAHLIAAKCQEAKIPVIALNFAQPGAYYFGGNNYLAGQLAGNFLCEYARKHWQGKVDKVLLLPAEGMGSTQEVRLAGILESLRRGLKILHKSDVIVAPAGFTARDGYRESKKILQRVGGKSPRIVAAALSDFLAMGASRIAEKMGLADSVTVVGTGAARDARNFIKRGGPFRASVAYFPESYGERVIALATRILEGEKVPLTTYTNHVVLTRSNIEQYYPS
jgi:ribose transport system substrate-binding protein